MAHFLIAAGKPDITVCLSHSFSRARRELLWELQQARNCRHSSIIIIIIINTSTNLACSVARWWQWWVVSMSPEKKWMLRQAVGKAHKIGNKMNWHWLSTRDCRQIKGKSAEFAQCDRVGGSSRSKDEASKETAGKWRRVRRATRCGDRGRLRQWCSPAAGRPAITLNPRVVRPSRSVPSVATSCGEWWLVVPAARSVCLHCTSTALCLLTSTILWMDSYDYLNEQTEASLGQPLGRPSASTHSSVVPIVPMGSTFAQHAGHNSCCFLAFPLSLSLFTHSLLVDVSETYLSLLQ